MQSVWKSLGMALLATGLCTSSPLAQAAGGDAANGQALAKRLCSNCHIVGDEAASATVAADVPSFKSIANLPEQSPERIAGRIVVPHPPMPQIEVTRNEIRDLAAYIMSLKGQ